MQESRWRWLFALTVIWGALIFWIAPHPPMVDLPQHAGQVALLRDILLGQSPWSDQFRINLFTPYILGYGLALPLSLIMPVAAALKLLLSLGYLVFVFMCVKLRQQFKADPRLDWLFLLGFFGFAYKWGFFTFLVAAPLGLWFILLSVRYADQRSYARGAGIVAVGLLMLASHGLVFLFAWGIGAMQTALGARKLKPLLLALVPYAILICACAGYFLISRHINAGLEAGLEQAIKWRWGLLRRSVLLYAAGGGDQQNMRDIFLPVFIVMAAAPWLMGLRIDWRRTSSWIPFAGVVFILAFVPHFAFNTAFLYERFALFLLPAYAWTFVSNAAMSERPRAAGRYAPFGLASLVVASWSILSLHTVWAWRFAQETAAFQEILQVLEPKQRALSLVFDNYSAAARSRPVYIHYPLWYQAEKQGLVDFNFAWFPPQIVRYRPDHLPAVHVLFDWFPERFDWKSNHGADYRYFFVRHDGPVPENLFRGVDCPPVSLITRERWTVFERRACP